MEHQPDMARLRAMAASPEGQRFLAGIQRSGGASLGKALEDAAKGDPAQAQQLLTTLLRDPQLRQLLQQMGGRL